MQRHPVIVEAAKMLIPTVALIDSNCSTKYITYPIAANDDTPCSIQLFADTFSSVIKEAKSYEIGDSEERNE